MKLENGHGEKNGHATPTEEEAPTEPEVKIDQVSSTTIVEEEEVAIVEQEEEGKQGISAKEAEATHHQPEVEIEIVAPSIAVKETVQEVAEERLDNVVAPPPLPELPPPSKMVQFAERVLSGEVTPDINIVAPPPLEDEEEMKEDILQDEIPSVIVEELAKSNASAEEDDKPVVGLVDAITDVSPTQENDVPPTPESKLAEDAEAICEIDAKLDSMREELVAMAPEIEIVDKLVLDSSAEKLNEVDSESRITEENSPKQEERIAETIALIDEVNEAALTTSVESPKVVEQEEEESVVVVLTKDDGENGVGEMEEEKEEVSAVNGNHCGGDNDHRKAVEEEMVATVVAQKAPITDEDILTAVGGDVVAPKVI